MVTGMRTMKQIRIQKKVPRPRRDRYEVLALDPRDPDIVRVKRGATPLTNDVKDRRAA